MNKFKDLVYIILSFVIVVLMVFMTLFYLSKRQHNIASSSVETITVTSNTTSQIQTTSESTSVTQAPTTNESTSTTSTDSSVTTTTTEQSVNHVSHGDNFRFLYTAAGGDTLQTIYELTGVDVETLANANDLDVNVVLVKGQRVYVP